MPVDNQVSVFINTNSNGCVSTLWARSNSMDDPASGCTGSEEMNVT